MDVDPSDGKLCSYLGCLEAERPPEVLSEADSPRTAAYKRISSLLHFRTSLSFFEIVVGPGPSMYGLSAALSLHRVVRSASARERGVLACCRPQQCG